MVTETFDDLPALSDFRPAEHKGAFYPVWDGEFEFDLTHKARYYLGGVKYGIAFRATDEERVRRWAIQLADEVGTIVQYTHRDRASQRPWGGQGLPTVADEVNRLLRNDVWTSIRPSRADRAEGRIAGLVDAGLPMEVAE